VVYRVKKPGAHGGYSIVTANSNKSLFREYLLHVWSKRKRLIGIVIIFKIWVNMGNQFIVVRLSFYINLFICMYICRLVEL